MTGRAGRAGRRSPVTRRGDGLRIVRRCAAFVLVTLAAAPALAQTPMQLPAVPDPAALDVIRAQLDAFNRHDVQAMVGNISTDFAWYFVEGDTMVLELQGRAAFETSMIRYFAAIPEARAEIDQMFEIGAYIAVRERAFWQLDGREVSAASLAVYEIRDSRIRRVWYYPAES